MVKRKFAIFLGLISAAASVCNCQESGSNPDSNNLAMMEEKEEFEFLEREISGKLDDDLVWNSELKIRQVLNVRGSLEDEVRLEGVGELRERLVRDGSRKVRRKAESSTVASSATTTSKAAATTAATTSSVSQSSGSISATSTTSAAAATLTSFPQPFDQILSTNFTSSTCPVFIQSFIADSSFEACLPVSLLLPTSTAFFTIEQSPDTLLPQLLDASCSNSPGMDTCIGIMANLADQIQWDQNCARDLAAGNALAEEALSGFRNYQLMREATCAKNNSTGNYCFQEAVRSTNPSDIYFYYLPQGTTLPSNTKPTCDACTGNLLSIFSNYASNSTLELSKVYSSARNLASASCGPTYAPLVATAVNGGVGRRNGYGKEGLCVGTAALVGLIWLGLV